MTSSIQPEPGMNDRLARHFMRRLRREAERHAVGVAVEAGFLREEYVDSGGRVLQVFYRGPALPEAASGPQAAAMLTRRRRRLIEESPHPVLGDGDLPVEEDEPQPSPSASAARVGAGRPSPEGIVPATEIVRAVREAAEPPKASEVATLLLVAQAVTIAEHADRSMLDILRQQRPIVAVH